MDRRYNLKDLALMTGFTDRTLRNYLLQGLLKGQKVDGVWQFTLQEVDEFFQEPFVKEGLRTKRNGIVYDYLADRKKKTPRICTVLDVPAGLAEANRISAFFCEEMKRASDVVFTFDREGGMCRVILSGAEDQVFRILKEYEERMRGSEA